MGHFWHIQLFTGEFADFDEIEDIYNALMATLCVICAGLAAGLTIGLLSLDITKLEIKIMTGTLDEKDAAQKILPIIKQHHLLLVTLLLFNAVANETLPVFLGALMPNYLAVIVSVSLVLIFGEIIPSAFFTGPNQLVTGARLTPLVYVLLALFYPVSYPISKILDYWFGEDDDTGSISRNELEALVILQGNERKRLARQNTINKKDENDQDVEGLSSHEVKLMTGILKLSKMTVQDAMIPIEKVCMISSATKLSNNSLQDILESGFSRIPVYFKQNKSHILGYMLVKELIVVDPSNGLYVSDVILREPLCVKPDLGLMELLGIFQQGQCHIALISTDPLKTLESLRQGSGPTESTGTVIGLVTMEDVLEKIIQNDIIDETDSNHNFKIFPHGGAPTIFYHQPNKLSHRQQPNSSNNIHRYSSKRKPKDRTPKRDSVVSSQYYGNRHLGTDSECETSYYQAQSLKIDHTSNGIYPSLSPFDIADESMGLIAV